jgi:hypothetical protein
MPSVERGFVPLFRQYQVKDFVTGRYSKRNGRKRTPFFVLSLVPPFRLAAKTLECGGGLNVMQG